VKKKVIDTALLLFVQIPIGILLFTLMLIPVLGFILFLYDEARIVIDYTTGTNLIKKEVRYVDNYECSLESVNVKDKNYYTENEEYNDTPYLPQVIRIKKEYGSKEIDMKWGDYSDRYKLVPSTNNLDVDTLQEYSTYKYTIMKSKNILHFPTNRNSTLPIVVDIYDELCRDSFTVKFGRCSFRKSEYTKYYLSKGAGLIVKDFYLYIRDLVIK